MSNKSNELFIRFTYFSYSQNSEVYMVFLCPSLKSHNLMKILIILFSPFQNQFSFASKPVYSFQTFLFSPIYSHTSIWGLEHLPQFFQKSLLFLCVSIHPQKLSCLKAINSHLQCLTAPVPKFCHPFNIFKYFVQNTI